MKTVVMCVLVGVLCGWMGMSMSNSYWTERIIQYSTLHERGNNVPVLVQNGGMYYVYQYIKPQEAIDNEQRRLLKGL